MMGNVRARSDRANDSTTSKARLFLLRGHLGWLAALAMMVLALPSRGHGATFTVDSTTDAVDAVPGNSVCATSGGACTLRAAIQEANALAGADSIDLPAGTYQLTLTGANEGATATGDLDVTREVTITGAGAASTIIDGMSADRVFDSSASSGRFALSGVTIRNGVVGASTGSSGGGIWAGSVLLEISDCIITANQAVDGGGIAGGRISVIRSTISANQASNLGGGLLVSMNGGYSTSLIDSTVADNQADRGGGLEIFSLGLDTGTMINSTVSGNRASGDGGGVLVVADAIFGPLVLTVSNSTITENRADSDGNGTGDGGGVALSLAFGMAGYSVDTSNTILADNIDGGGEAPDCWAAGGTVRGRGYNLLGNPAGCVFDPASVLTGNISGSALLFPLAANGGPTDTHHPIPISPVVNAGNPAVPGSGPYTCATTDQRGYARPFGSACDIGAVEVTTTTTTTTTSTTTTTLVAGPCGNGVLNLGEQCDDANAFDNCCDDGCQFVPSNLDCFVPDDGNPCTHGLCDGAGTCVQHAAPYAELIPGRCEQAQIPGKARMRVRDKSPDKGDRIAWKYAGGPGIYFGADLGYPDPFTFCAYDNSGVVARAAIPGDLMCVGVPCWKQKDSTAYSTSKFKDRSATADGAYGILSKKSWDSDTKSKAAFKGKGDNLVFTPPPWTGPVTVELGIPNGGECYSTTFTTPTKNETGIYKAKGN